MVDPEMAWLVGQVVAGVLAADLASGIVHWLEDAYGKEEWRVIGPRVIEPNIRHHYAPLDFTRASYLKRNGPILVIVVALGCLLAAMGWINAFTLSLMIAGSQANETHRWAHMPARRVPRWVRPMQRLGLMLSQRHHGEHHRAPFAVRYCTVTGLVNPLIDRLGLFRGAEWLIRAFFGLERRQDTGRRPALASRQIG